ncbi:MAG: DUF3450 domain-containing protein [Gammaproteobacteria bacterium]|nr:DUF3450 domain-containing protein [Gammaproteobacteria bacterium]
MLECIYRFTVMRKIYFVIIFYFLWGGHSSIAAAPETQELIPALNTQQVIQKEAKKSQRSVDALDDETQELLTQYRLVSKVLDDLEAYNSQMRSLLADQRTEMAAVERQLDEIEVTKRGIVPLLERMVEVLEHFIALDAPFLPKERGMRVAELREMLSRADVALPEKYRRILEAYRIETEYGHTIEAYRGELHQQEVVRTVEFLRLGRTALYYLSFDAKTAGYWDRQEKRWKPLPERLHESVVQGLRIAKKQAPPDLINLPISAPQTPP